MKAFHARHAIFTFFYCPNMYNVLSTSFFSTVSSFILTVFLVWLWWSDHHGNMELKLIYLFLLLVFGVKEELKIINEKCFCHSLKHRTSCFLVQICDDKCAYFTHKQKRLLKVSKGSGGYHRLVLKTTKTFTFLRCDL